MHLLKGVRLVLHIDRQPLDLMYRFGVVDGIELTVGLELGLLLGSAVGDIIGFSMGF